MSEIAIALGLFTPGAVAVATPFLGGRENIRDGLAVLGAIISFFGAVTVAQTVLAGTTPNLTLFTIADGLDMAFAVTPAGAVFGCVASGLWVMASLYSIGYMRGNNEQNQTRFATCYAVAIHAAMGIAWSGNLMVLFIFYEILTFSTYPLVIHKQSQRAMQAGRLYLAILVGASLVLFLPALIWVWLVAGTLDFTQGGILAGKIDPAYLPWLLGLCAFGVGKVALMPLHRWLPAAMVAPTPVSALLHAVAVVKAGAFTIVTLVVYIFGLDLLAETGASQWLAWVAAFTILTASIIAITKDDLKARLAYSTVSQLSYIVLGAALASALALEGALLHITMHATAKITLFFCAGAIYVATQYTKVSQLDGLGRQMPLIFVAFFLGALSIIGVPPLGGGWSKFMLMAGAVAAEMPLMVAVLAVSTLLNVYYLLDPVFRGFFKPLKGEGSIETLALPQELRQVPQAPPILTVIPPVISAILCLVLFFAVGVLTPFSQQMVMP